MEGPDHKASLEPDELKAMIKAIREVSVAIGDGIKAPTTDEMENIGVARKSLVANVTISKGDIFTEANLTIKRPGTGISPDMYWTFIGKPAEQSYCAGELIVE